MRGRRPELPEGRRAAWHADERRVTRGTAEGSNDSSPNIAPALKCVDLTLAFAAMADNPRLINDFAAHVLEVMHAISRRAPVGAIKIVSRIELPASLSDKEARPTGVAQRPEPGKM